MAQYHFHLDVCSGGTGAAVASAAYQSGQTLTDDFGKTKEYQNVERVVYTNLLTPDNAPAWATDRQTLWRSVEQKEGMRGQYARKYNIALPNELSVDQQIELANEIAAYYRDKGMCVDYAVHQDLNSKKPADQRNTHLHVMTTMRQFNPDGTWAQKWRNVTVRDRNGKAICVGRDKNGRKRYKHAKMAINNWSERDELINQRRMVADLSNAALAKAGFAARVDHRSYLDQGIFKIPTKHLGHANATRERRGIRTPTGEYNRAAKQINDKLRYANSRIASIDEEVKQNVRKQRNSEIARRRRTRNKRKQETYSKQSFAANRIKMYYVRKRLVDAHGVDNKSFAASKPDMFMLSKRERTSLERRRRGNNNNRLSKLRLMTWVDLSQVERKGVLKELNKYNDWVFASDKQKHILSERAMFIRSKTGLHMYPLGREVSRHKPGDSLTANDIQEDCRAAYNASGGGGLREAAKGLKSAADSITAALDPNKTSWQHAKAAMSDVKTIVATPVTIARDILANPLTGLLKAPLRAAAAAAKTTSAVINTAGIIGKGGDGGRARGIDCQSSR